MSVKHLAKTSGYAVGANNKEHVMVAPLSVHEETFTSMSPQSFILGNNTSVDLYPPQDAIIKDLRLKMTITNNSGTDTLAYRTIFDWMDELKNKLNNTEFLRYNNDEEIRFQYSQWFYNNNDNQLELNTDWSITNNLNADAIALATIAPGATRNIEVSLLPILPFYKDLVCCGVQKITMDFRWKSPQGSPAELNQWIKNLTADANVAPSVAVSSAEIKAVYHHTHQHARHNGKQTLNLTLFEVNRQALDMSVVSRKFKYNLANEFSQRKKVSAVYYHGFDRTGNAAYNSSNAISYNGVFSTIGVEHFVKGRSVKELSSETARRYEEHERNRRHGKAFNPNELANRANLVWHHVAISHTQNCNDAVTVVEGINNNSSSNHEIEFNVESALTASVDFFVGIKYHEILEISPDGSVRIMN